MLSSRMKQFREYNNLSIPDIAKLIGVDASEYEAYESGEITPDIDTITKLAVCYKVTVDEFYGYTPRLTLFENDTKGNDKVDEVLLKMSDLSWDEVQLVLYYRQKGKKDDLIEAITKELYQKPEEE